LLSSSSESTRAGYNSSGKAPVMKMIERLNLEGGEHPLQHCGAMEGKKEKGKGKIRGGV